MKTSDLFTEFRNPSIQYRMLPLFRVNDDVVQEEIEWQVRANKRDGGHRPMVAATGAAFMKPFSIRQDGTATSY